MKHLQNRHRVYVRFPKVGLGNMLLVWSRAKVFCRINNLEPVVSSWWGFHWGAIIRRENRTRFYYRYFKESPFRLRLLICLSSFFRNKQFNPPLAPVLAKNHSLFIFNKVNVHEDLFMDLREHRDFIKMSLYEQLHPRIHKLLDSLKTAPISIHIRRGDFRNGNALMPLSYFATGIKLVRSVLGKQLAVLIFTDADTDEIAPLLSLGNIKLANKAPDIADILLMSRSDVIFLSQSSSFSYWAAFLSYAFVVMPYNDWQNRICDEDTNFRYKEFRWNYTDLSSNREFEYAIKNFFKFT